MLLEGVRKMGGVVGQETLFSLILSGLNKGSFKLRITPSVVVITVLKFENKMFVGISIRIGSRS